MNNDPFSFLRDSSEKQQVVVSNGQIKCVLEFPNEEFVSDGYLEFSTTGYQENFSETMRLLSTIGEMNDCPFKYKADWKRIDDNFVFTAQLGLSDDLSSVIATNRVWKTEYFSELFVFTPHDVWFEILYLKDLASEVYLPYGPWAFLAQCLLKGITAEAIHTISQNLIEERLCVQPWRVLRYDKNADVFFSAAQIDFALELYRRQ